MDFNADYVNSFPNAKAFIDDYDSLDSGHGLTDDELIGIYNELHISEHEVDKTAEHKANDPDGAYIDISKDGEGAE